MTSASLRNLLATADIAAASLEGPGGSALVTTPSARMLGIWPKGARDNLLWTNPKLPGRPDRHGGWSAFGAGGLGGDRLWMGPEYRFYWNGPPRSDLSNWQVPAAIDGGNYRLTSHPKYVELEQMARLPLGDSGRTFDVFVARRFSLAEPPCTMMRGVGCVALREERRLRLDTKEQSAEADTWSVSQVPVGAWLLVPVNGPQELIPAYEQAPGAIARGVRRADGLLCWHVTGESAIKAALSVEAVTGRVAVVRPDGPGRHTLLVKSFLPCPGRPYLDGLFPASVGAQCVQLWDGNGYGEIEVHSPTATVESPSLIDDTLIWASSGPTNDIRVIATRQLCRTLPDEVFAP